MIDGLLAGTPTKPVLPAERLALLPAAATIRQPAASARRPDRLVGLRDLAMSAPSDMEITWQPLVTAQSMPARMPLSVPEPSLLSTLPTKIGRPLATP